MPRNYDEFQFRSKKQLNPRPYQQEAIAAWTAHRRRGVVVLPTGAGIKLLTDACVFEIHSAIEPEELRHQLFLHARAFHPLSVAGEDDRRTQAISEVAGQLGCTSSEVENGLYADLLANQVLREFGEPQPVELLERYNLAQAQALIYRAIEMRLWVTPEDAAGARQLFDAIKAYRLIHSIYGTAREGYEVRLTGPVSMFHRSQKYGIQMAVFLPALLGCSNWRMRAEIAPALT